MKLRLMTLLGAGAALSLAAAENPPPFKDTKEKASYSIGVSIGKNFKAQGADLSLEIVLQGMKDAVEGKKTLMTDQEIQETMMSFSSQMRAKVQEKQKEAGEKNRKEGEAFLAENKKKDGVKTTPSGLQYKVITLGTGPKPATNDTVVTHYRGTLIDGTEFDSSYKRGEPATFPVTGVIKGWTEALQLMPVGSKWQLFIPSELAYGPSGRPSIPPSSTLLFDLELISIKESVKDANNTAVPKLAK
jgi:FKBP-type peptidyl-prolyl cis-trans isomerase FklB